MYRLQKHDARSTGLHWQIHKDAAADWRAGRRPHGGRRRARHRPDHHLRGLGAASQAHRRDHGRGLPARPPGRDGALQDRRPQVPANAEIVLEGYCERGELRDEGPFGDHTGYYTPVDRFPVLHLTAMTMRRDAIYPSILVGPPPMEDAWLGKATERLFLPAIRTDRAGDRRLRPPRRRRLPQRLHRLDPQGLPRTRAQGHARDLGDGAALADEGHRGRRRARGRARLQRGRLAARRQRRPRARRRALVGPARPARPRALARADGRQARPRRDATWESEGYARSWPEIAACRTRCASRSTGAGSSSASRRAAGRRPPTARRLLAHGAGCGRGRAEPPGRRAAAGGTRSPSSARAATSEDCSCRCWSRPAPTCAPSTASRARWPGSRASTGRAPTPAMRGRWPARLQGVELVFDVSRSERGAADAEPAWCHVEAAAVEAGVRRLVRLRPLLPDLPPLGAAPRPSSSSCAWRR